MESYNIIRLATVLVAAMSIYFGYRLFYIVTERQGKLKIQNQDYSLQLSDVGPGVFFELFGAVVIIVVTIWQPYSEKTTTSADGSIQKISRDPANSSNITFAEELENLCVNTQVEAIFLQGTELLKRVEIEKMIQPHATASEDILIDFEYFIDSSNAPEKFRELHSGSSSYFEIYFITLGAILNIYYENNNCF